MLNKTEFQAANDYNKYRISSNKLDVDSLPWQWQMSDWAAFVWCTVIHQMEFGLTIDGKLGPKTEESIKEHCPSIEMPYETSNAIIVYGKRFSLPPGLIEEGLSASNFLDDGLFHFEHTERDSDDVTLFVLHETCGNTAEGCVNTLKANGYGVQLILDPSGHLYCHGDLVLDRMIHANQCNNKSFGIEIVNPYAPQYISNNNKDVFDNFIDAEWWTWTPDKNDRRYVTPTKAQLHAIKLLAPWLCCITGVPYMFPTANLSVQKRKIDGYNGSPRAIPDPGVVAHRDFAGHSDGRFILEQLIAQAQA